MSKRSSLYKRYRFPPTIIQHVVWLHHRFNLSNLDIEDHMAERGIGISYESIRLWCIKFGPKYARRLRRRHKDYGDTFFIDEVFVKIQGRQHYLWRAVDQDGEAVDVFLPRRREGKAAKRFFKRLLRTSSGEPRRIVTDELRSYGVAHRDLVPDTIHDTSQYAYNRAEKLICQYAEMASTISTAFKSFGFRSLPLGYSRNGLNEISGYENHLRLIRRNLKRSSYGHLSKLHPKSLIGEGAGNPFAVFFTHASLAGNVVPSVFDGLFHHIDYRAGFIRFEVKARTLR